jgi:alpha-tubulin suppressor-like RCC1 family protein
LGIGTTTDSSTPVQVSDLTGVTGVAAGLEDSLALKSDGTVWAWGYNNEGQLGNGTSDIDLHPTPVQVSGLTGVTGVAAGGWYGLALKGDGTVWAWGINSVGQLGNGTTTNSNTPVEVEGAGGSGYLTDVTAIAAGGRHSLALRRDGTVWAWGWNSFGQLGIGTSDSSPHPTPVQVSGLTDVIAVAAGYGHSLALRRDGTVWAWGRNNWGQLGNGTTTNSNTPVEVEGTGGSGYLTDVTAIGAGTSHSLALRRGGTVWAWGYNNEGELGDGTTTNSSTPVQVSGLTDVTAIAAGGNHSLALGPDGNVLAWGDNSFGQLGNGTTTNSSTPVQASGLTDVTAIAGGNAHSLAVKGPPAPSGGPGGGGGGGGGYHPWPTPTPNPNTGEGYANPVVGGDVTSRDGRVTLQMPGGAVDKLVKLWYQRYCSSEIAPPPGWEYVGCPFDLRAVDASDETVQLDQFKQPVKVTVHYTDTEAQGLDPSTLRIGYYDGGKWVFYPSQVDAQAHTVTARVGHFSLHALLGSATPVGSAVSGRVFYDRNGDGVDDGGDFPIAKAGVKIVGGDGYYAFTTTASDGGYSFGSLGQGSYTVSLVVGPEWTFTTPNQMGDIELSGESGSRRTDVDFGMWYRLP